MKFVSVIRSSTHSSPLPIKINTVHITYYKVKICAEHTNKYTLLSKLINKKIYC